MSPLILDFEVEEEEEEEEEEELRV
jgi:hypothetical protein